MVCNAGIASLHYYPCGPYCATIPDTFFSFHIQEVNSGCKNIPHAMVLECNHSNSCSDSLFTKSCFPSCTDEFHSTSPCNLYDEEEMEISGPEEFSIFREDLVAEQLTYMDAVCTVYVLLEMLGEILLGF